MNNNSLPFIKIHVYTTGSTKRRMPTHTNAYQHIPTHAIQCNYISGIYMLSSAQILFHKANCEILYRYNQPNDQNPQFLCP